MVASIQPLSRPPMPPPSALNFAYSPLAPLSLRSSQLCSTRHRLLPSPKLPSAQLQPPRPRSASPPAPESKSRPESPQSSPPWLRPYDSDAPKVPTAPWMPSPLLLPADQVLDLSNPRRSGAKKKSDASLADRALTDKVRGGRGRYAMLGIIRNIKTLRQIHPPEPDEDAPSVTVADAELSVDLDLPLGQDLNGKVKRAPWVAVEEKLVFRREKKVREITAAESVLAPDLLFRLRGQAKGMKKWVRAKKAGVTEEVVKEIRRGWRKNELVMVKIVEPLRRNMDRAREIVETKTGGLVVWSIRDLIVVYRGEKYQMFLNKSHNAVDTNNEILQDNSTIISVNSDGLMNEPIAKDRNVHCTDLSNVHFETQNLIEGSLYEREANRLLSGLGPRFIDWWWKKPLPVDADLLPEVVPGFEPPLRMCPPGERTKLTDDELTYLRKLARSLPTHFALGRNNKLEGLAASIIKLWKKSLIAKIAVKVGIQNTSNEQMSLVLKRLTGGVLILRNKFFIILYRGKDFLPDGMAELIEGREAEINEQQLKEEDARIKYTNSLHTINAIMPRYSTVGSYMEFQDIQANYIAPHDLHNRCRIQIEAEKAKVEKELRKLEHELFIMKQKIEKSDKQLTKLRLSWCCSEQTVDQETLTEEERQAFRKVGLAMDEVIPLGRRGIYDGLIESIHQHWKHREVAKLTTKQTLLRQITYTARLLEIESGGVLVAVEKLRTSHVIIIYRGKNYTRSLKSSNNLLSKREALQRSIEVQRRGSLKYFAREREKLIWGLKQRLTDLERQIEETTL